MEKESKVSPVFMEVIKSYLDRRAESDEAFAREYANEKKSVEGCCTFILGEVRRSGRQALTDDEVFGMAVHYYDEEGLTVEPLAGHVTVVVPGTEVTGAAPAKPARKAKAKAKKEAKEPAKKAAKKAAKEPTKAKAKDVEPQQLSLF